MPSASDEQHTLMHKWFGDPISDSGPLEFLESHGFKITPGWEWQKPTPSHTLSCYELECINFLIDEWDFGWIANSTKEPFICLCGQLSQQKGHQNALDA